MIFIGVAVVGISMFMITPETARSDNRLFAWGTALIAAVFWFGLVILLAMVLSSAKVIGLAVKLVIESVDQKVLGTDITVGVSRLSICRGFVNIANLVVQNPPGDY